MKIATLITAAVLALSSTMAFAQSTNAPGASTIGGEANPNAKSSTTSGGASSQAGSGMTGGNASGGTSGGMTSGSSMAPSANDASKSGAPAADNAQKPRSTTSPDNSTTTR